MNFGDGSRLSKRRGTRPRSRLGRIVVNPAAIDKGHFLFLNINVVFGNHWEGRAEKRLEMSINVIRV